VRVEAPPAVTELGLRVAVRPAGVVAERLTAPAVPVTSAVLIVLVPELPCTTVRLLGLAVIEKSFPGAALTLTNTSATRTTGPSVPTASMPWRPTGTAGPTVMVIVEPPPAVIEEGLKVAVRPGSVEEKERATVPGLPITVVLIAAVMLEP
jgi:lipoprotein-anchoring transpeptidase ErfK/SrfK